MGAAQTSSTTNTAKQEDYNKGAFSYISTQNPGLKPQQPKYEFVPNPNVNPGYNPTMMGNIFPNQNIPQQINKQIYKATISMKNLKDAFKTFNIEGKYLNKDRFNDAIESIFLSINIPEMHYTYLSNKIGELLDESGDGKIQEEEFLTGMKNVLSNREFRLKCKTSTLTFSNNACHDE